MWQSTIGIPLVHIVKERWVGIFREEFENFRNYMIHPSGFVPAQLGDCICQPESGKSSGDER
eukprot:10436102-Prorocentrum_lima.AAC.1